MKGFRAYRGLSALVVAALLAIAATAHASDRKSERRALIIGDSQVYGAFGGAIHEDVRQQGYTVETHSVCSASSFTFLRHWETPCGYLVRRSRAEDKTPHIYHLSGTHKVPSINELMRQQPELVILVLGTNNGTAPKNARRFARLLVRRILATPSVKRVVWIGPPALRGPDYLARNINVALSTIDRASFIDSRPFNADKPLPRSHEHFGPRKARRWASWVWTRLQADLPNS